MEFIINIFGEGKDLTLMQMVARSVVIFFVCLILIRISGRRSFGIRTPLDNIVVILLGALLSRAVVGASPFMPIIGCALTFVLLHRMLGWLITKSRLVSSLVEGEKICLFEKGDFVKENLKKSLVCQEDVMQ